MKCMLIIFFPLYQDPPHVIPCSLAPPKTRTRQKKENEETVFRMEMLVWLHLLDLPVAPKTYE